MTNRQSLSAKILRLLVHLQRNNKFIAEDFDTGLRIAESSVLLEIDTLGTVGLTRLAERMQLEVGSTLQIARRLQEKKFIVSKKVGIERLYTVSEKGHKLLQHYDDFSAHFLIDFSIGLDEKHLTALEKLFVSLADSGCFQESILRRNDVQLRLQMRRMTISFGLLHRRFRESHLTVAEWQVLWAVQEGMRQPKKIIEALGLAQNYVSQILKKLGSAEYVSKTISKEDHRQREILLLPEGRKVLEAVNRDLRSQISKAIKGISAEDRLYGISALEKFVGENRSLEFKIPGTRYVIRSAEDENDLNKSRVFFLKQLFQRNDSPRVPAVLFPPGMPTYLIEADGQVVGVLGLEMDTSGASVALAMQDRGVNSKDFRFFTELSEKHSRRFLQSE